MLHWACALLAIAALQAVILVHKGALASAMLVLAGAIGLGWGLWQLQGRPGAMPRRLRLHSNGRASLFSGDAVVEAILAPGSMRLGPFVLLVLRSSGSRPVRLLLGPGILGAPELAALGRWLPRAAGGGGTTGGSGVD
jgi:hypothetical protein